MDLRHLRSFVAVTVERKPIDPPVAWIMTLLCAIWGLQQVVIKLAAPSMRPLFQVGVRSGVVASILLALVCWSSCS